MPIQARNRDYKERILSAPYEICIERARYYTESYRKSEGQDPAIRAAKAFAHTLRNMSVHISDTELIAGNRSSKIVGAVIPVERGDINSVLDIDLDFLTTRERQPFHIAPEDERELRKTILPYWRGKTLRDRKKVLWKANGLHLKPALNPLSLYRRSRSLNMTRLREAAAVPRLSLSYLYKGVGELLYNNPALIMNVFDVQGHLILGLKNILREGFAGLRARAVDSLEGARRDASGGRFLEGIIICCDAMRDFAARFAEEAVRLAEQSPDPQRRHELEQIAVHCRHVPYHPPRDFREAIQALWLAECGALAAYGMAGIFAIGRCDQYLYPFYAKDKAEGRITAADATGLVEELLIKLSCGLLVLPAIGKATGSELGSDSASPTIGGLDRDGEDAVNELSYLLLDAYTNVKSMGNSFMIRLSQKSPELFWRKALGSYRQTSGAALFCDEITIEALKRCGMSEGDARDYGVIGCVEPTGDGNTFGCTSGNDISFTGALEMALLNGYLRIMGKRIGPKTGDPRKFTNFHQLMQAFKEQVAFMVATVAKATNLKDEAYIEAFPNPYVSATLTGCIENARDMTAGGAQYNFGSISARGLGTAVDSLAAVKHFVYDEQNLSMAQLMRALDRNFKGAEALRQRLANKGPKYGCDDPRADAIAREVAEFFCREVTAHKTVRGGPYRPSFFSFGMHVLEGLLLGATPNGRCAGEPVSNSLSPSNGSERDGPTGVLQSVAKIDHTLISNGCALNLKLMPGMFDGEERLGKMVSMVKTYFALGGMEIQPNVVSNATLIDAQMHPENYRDLVVRVSGYSAYFTDLGRALQDEIIQRTEFESP